VIPVAGRPARRAVLAVALGAAAAGCVRVPDRGPVSSRPRSTDGTLVPDIRTYPEPPVDGIGPQAVVNGFLEACAVPGPDFDTARRYLTATAAARWDPTVAVTVFGGQSFRDPGPVSVRSVSESITLTGTLMGRLDPAGTFTAAPGATAWSVRFTLARQAGQWRLADPPAGLLVADDDFTRQYSPWEVLFLNPAGTSTVPDAVYLPDRGAPAAALVQRLVAGPSAWLAPAVRSALPRGTGLSSTSLPVSDSGVARVDLDDRAGGLDDATKVLLSAQVVTTLRQLGSTVSAVALSAGGGSLSPRAVPLEQPIDSWQQLDADVLSAGSGDLGVLSQSGGRPVLLRGDPATLTAARDVAPGLFAGGLPRSLAIDPRTGGLAVVPADGTGVLLGPAPGAIGAVRRVLTGTGLTRPQFTRTGGVWTVDAAGRVLAWDGVRAVTVPVDLRDLVSAVPVDTMGARVSRVVLARDGQRAAVVLSVPRRGQLVVLVRVRQRAGRAFLDSPRLVTSSYPVVHDLAWMGAVTLVLLARDPTSTLQVVQLRQDGSAVQQLGTPPDGVAVAAGPGARSIVVGGSDGVLYVRPFPLRWVPVVPATPTPTPTTTPTTTPTATPTATPAPTGTPTANPTRSPRTAAGRSATSAPPASATGSPVPPAFVAPVYPG